MKHYATVIALLVLSNAWLPGASTRLAAQEPVVEDAGGRVPVFPYAGGWLGADGAYSIPLGSNRSLWLFGDTFVGDSTTTLRSKSKTMVRNSIGLSTCRQDKTCTLRYYWKDPGAAKPRSFFDTGRDDVWYWPLDGYLSGKTLYLSVMVVRNRPGASSKDALGFEVVGTKWIRVTNLSASPEQWKIAENDMSAADILPGVSMVADGRYLLFYAHVPEKQGKGYMTVLRVARNKLADPAAHWEYLGKDSEWHAGTPHGDAAHVIDQSISEMSVRYHPAWKKWAAVSTGPEGISNRVVARFADKAIGPWSEPVTVFQFPEMTPSHEGYDRETFCYAAKEHVELDDSRLLVTYACNSFSFDKVMSNMAIYRPQAVALERPKP